MRKIKIRKNKNKKGIIKNIFKWILLGIFSLGILLILAGGLFFYIIAKDAPDFDPEKLYKQNATVIYDSKGEIITKLGTEKRVKISYNELPQVLVDAVVATEDSKFFEHSGIDLLRFIKASIGQVMGNSSAGGGSTITMQVAKNSYTSFVDSGWEGIKRKFTDIYISVFKIEKNYTKEEILEFYVNSYCLGGSNYGVEQASQTYFGKSVSELNLSEAAIIAGLFQMPNGYNPLNYPDAAAKRRSTVLYLMNRHGYITSAEKEIAESIPVSRLTANSKTNIGDKYIDFIDTVVAQVTEMTGRNPYTSPMEIYTTMDRKKQDYINSITNGSKFKWENKVVQTGIMVLDTQKGAIVAVGGGRNRSGQNTYNFATMINKQIGSSAKPLYDYGPAIEYNKLSPADTIVDEPYTYSNGTKISNFDNKYQGLITARTALAGSRNIPALKTFKSVNNEKIREFVTNLGLHPETYLHEAHAIGAYGGLGTKTLDNETAGENPLSMAGAYAAFGNGGYYNEPYSFTKIIYSDTGETYEPSFVKKQAMSAETAYIINDMLITTGKKALGNYSNIKGYTYGAKTGTTNFDSKVKEKYKLADNAINDLWVVGLTDQYTIAVWYGYEKISNKYYTRFGNQNHKLLFQTVAKGIFERSTKVTKPANVISVTVEKDSVETLLPSAYTPANMKITDLFVKGSEPATTSTRYAQLSDVTDLISSYSSGEVTLSWTGITNPNAIDSNYLKTYWTDFYSDTGYLNKALTARQKYNTSYIGIVNYDVYTKDGLGNLTLIGSTANTSYTYSISSNANPITYVVKSAYSIFKANASQGVETTVSFSADEPIITYQIQGDNPTTIATGDTYTDEGIKLFANLTDVTTSASIITSVLNSSQTFISNGTTIPATSGTYYIRYVITYNDYNRTVLRTVIRQ